MFITIIYHRELWRFRKDSLIIKKDILLFARFIDFLLNYMFVNTSC